MKSMETQHSKAMKNKVHFEGEVKHLMRTGGALTSIKINKNMAFDGYIQWKYVKLIYMSACETPDVFNLK